MKKPYRGLFIMYHLSVLPNKFIIVNQKSNYEIVKDNFVESYWETYTFASTKTKVYFTEEIPEWEDYTMYTL